MSKIKRKKISWDHQHIPGGLALDYFSAKMCRKPNFCCFFFLDVSEDETYVIEVLEQNHSDSENEDSKDFIDSLKETNQTFSDKDSGLFCNECSTFFEKRKKYEIHFKENHKTKLYFTCQVCTKQFDL